MVSNSLSKSQKEIIKATGKVVLKSCPGSGKTHVVACKAVEQIENWELKNKGIAILTFTNVASEELKSRINEISKCKIDYPHYIGTLDSFITQYIFLPFGHLVMQCEEKPTIIHDFSIKALNHGLKSWKGICHRNACAPLDFYFDENGELQNTKKIKTCVLVKNRPCEKFKLYCYKHGYATFKDVTIIALKVLNGNREVAELLAKRFCVLIVDEAQDTSADQMKIMDLLVENGLSEIMLIGDPDQAIYEWRDADPSIFMEKYIDKSWYSQLLNENFRCSQKICNATKIFSTLLLESLAVGDSADCDFIPEIIKYDPKDIKSTIEYFMDKCDSYKLELSHERIAVLSRGKAGLLGRDYSQIKDLWKNQLTKLLSEATFERDMGSLNRAIVLVEKSLYSIFIKDNISNEVEINEIDKIIQADVWRKMIFEFCKCLPSSDTKLNTWKTSMGNIIEDIASKYDLQKIGDSEIKTKIRVTDSNLKDFLEQPIKDFYAKSYAGAYLNATIHAVKGRTFEAVLLIIGTNGKLTSNMLNTSDIESEAIRTAYVAMTRARKILMIAIPKSVKDRSLTRFNDANWRIVNEFKT